jgi:hypothetical protein
LRGYGGISKPDTVRFHAICTSVLLEDPVREVKKLSDTENFRTELQSREISEEDQLAISTIGDQTRKLELDTKWQ